MPGAAEVVPDCAPLPPCTVLPERARSVKGGARPESPRSAAHRSSASLELLAPPSPLAPLAVAGPAAGLGPRAVKREAATPVPGPAVPAAPGPAAPPSPWVTPLRPAAPAVPPWRPGMAPGGAAPRVKNRPRPRPTPSLAGSCCWSAASPPSPAPSSPSGASASSEISPARPGMVG